MEKILLALLLGGFMAFRRKNTPVTVSSVRFGEFRGKIVRLRGEFVVYVQQGTGPETSLGAYPTKDEARARLQQAIDEASASAG